MLQLHNSRCRFAAVAAHPLAPGDEVMLALILLHETYALGSGSRWFVLCWCRALTDPIGALHRWPYIRTLPSKIERIGHPWWFSDKVNEALQSPQIVISIRQTKARCSLDFHSRVLKLTCLCKAAAENTFSRMVVPLMAAFPELYPAVQVSQTLCFKSMIEWVLVDRCGSTV